MPYKPYCPTKGGVKNPYGGGVEEVVEPVAEPVVEEEEVKEKDK